MTCGGRGTGAPGPSPVTNPTSPTRHVRGEVVRSGRSTSTGLSLAADSPPRVRSRPPHRDAVAAPPGGRAVGGGGPAPGPDAGSGSAWSVGVSDHCPGRSVLFDMDKAHRLVEPARWIRFGHAETHSPVPLTNTGMDQFDEEPATDPLVPTRPDDCDGQFGDIFGDEAVAVACLGERPIPSRAHRFALFGNQSIVAWPRPSREIGRVALIGEHLVSGRRRLVRAPDCGLAEHRREKGEVLRPCRAIPNVVHLGKFSRLAAHGEARQTIRRNADPGWWSGHDIGAPRPSRRRSYPIEDTGHAAGSSADSPPPHPGTSGPVRGQAHARRLRHRCARLVVGGLPMVDPEVHTNSSS